MYSYKTIGNFFTKYLKREENFMEEKVLYLTLPEGARYQKVIIAEEGKIGIVYSEEYTGKVESKQEQEEQEKAEMLEAKVSMLNSKKGETESIQEEQKEVEMPEAEPIKMQNKKGEANVAQNQEVAIKIPKPKPLIGGGEVYQVENLPYWFCKIKNGRDTFMHVYMEDLSIDDLLKDAKTGAERKFVTSDKIELKNNALKALQNKPIEGFRWVPVYEVSTAPGGSLQFIKGEKPLTELKCPEWETILKAYSPENESSMISKTTYLLLTVRFLKDGIATLEEVMECSMLSAIHSENSKQASEETKKQKELGGLGWFGGDNFIITKDGNTYHTFKNASEYSMLSAFHNNHPEARVFSGYSFPELKK